MAESEPDPHFPESREDDVILGRSMALVAALGLPSLLRRDGAGPPKADLALFVAYLCVRRLVRPWSADPAERWRLRRYTWGALRRAFVVEWTRSDKVGAPRTAVAAIAIVRSVLREAFQAYCEARLKRPRQWVDEGTPTAGAILQIAKHEARKLGADDWQSDEVAQETFLKFYEHDGLVAWPDAFVRTMARRLCLGKRTRHLDDDVDPELIGVAATVEVRLDDAVIRREFEIFKQQYERDPRGVRLVELDCFDGHGPMVAQAIEFERTYPAHREELLAKTRDEVRAARGGSTREPTARARHVLKALGPGATLAGPAYERAIEDAAEESYKVILRSAKLRAFNEFRERFVEKDPAPRRSSDDDG